MKILRSLLGTLALTSCLVLSGYSQSFLTNGLIAYYPFQGNANDASGNGNHGVLTGAVLTTDRLNQPSDAFSFNATNSAISVPAFFDAGQADYTITFWFNTANAQQLNQTFINSCPNPTLQIEYNQPINSAQGYVSYSIGTGTGWVQPTQRHGTKNDYQANSWYQVALVKQSSQFTIYIDGTVDNTSSAVVPATGLIGLEFGALCNSSTSMPTNAIPTLWGKLDELRFYNRALPTSEIQQLYVLESGPRVNLVKAVKPAFSNLYLGTNYQLQVSTDLSTWTNYGAAFPATNIIQNYPQYFEVGDFGQLFFRLQVTP